MEELILGLHFTVILFFVLGFPLALIWNHRIFRWVHAGGLACITLLMILGIPCPLTVWEESLRDLSYEGSFIAAWLRRWVYLEWISPRHVFYIDLGFTALVFSSFIWRPLTKTRPSRKE